MDDVTLKKMLTATESDQVERKESLADKNKIREAICAFANDLLGHGTPGFIFVGARDNGSLAKLAVTDQLLQDLASMRDDGNIHPFPSLKVEKRLVDGDELAVVTVQPSAAPPVRFKGRTWIRVGSRRAIATPEEEKRLAERRRSADLPFDLQPLPSASLADLDLDLFERTYLPAIVAPEVLEENRRSREDQLQALRLSMSSGCPTVLGVLVLGQDPRGLVPGAYVQFVRFEGTALHDPIRDQKDVNAPLPELLRRLDEILEAHNEIATSLTAGPIEIQSPSYPLPALQQLLRNAVLHRTYEGTSTPVRCYWFDDRIEIHSPGGPYGQVTPENFGQPGITDYRNPHLAEAMRALGYVQRFGVGIALARKALADNRHPPPEFEVQPTFVLATIKARS